MWNRRVRSYKWRMLSAEQNDLITRTGPGTAAGALMRRYWQPAALVDELSGNRPVKPVRLLGEDLVAFRDDKGRYGLIARACPHRGTDLVLRAAGGRRPALRLPRLAVRRHRAMSGDAGRARGQPAVREHPPEGLSGGGEERHPVRLYGAGRAAAVPAFRLLRRAVDAHLRVQGPDRLQLAAVARGRHRPRAHLVPAPLLPRRGPEAGLRQAVPRHLDRFRDPDDAADARAHRARRSRSSRPTTACASSRCAGSATPTRMCA